MVEIIEAKLAANGWAIRNEEQPHVWCKNHAEFDTLNDLIISATGVKINFHNHGEGIIVRFKCAERIALTGSF